MAVVLGLCCVFVVAAGWSWLHVNARRLRLKTSRLSQWPALLPLYYAALLSAAAKPRRFRKHAKVQEQQFAVGACRSPLPQHAVAFQGSAARAWP